MMLEVEGGLDVGIVEVGLDVGLLGLDVGMVKLGLTMPQLRLTIGEDNGDVGCGDDYTTAEVDYW